MCVFSPPPPPPPLPDPEPTAPKAEKTADAVVTGQQRTSVKKKGQKLGRTAAREAGRKGTASLRIPLLGKKETTRSGNLNTPI